MNLTILINLIKDILRFVILIAISYGFANVTSDIIVCVKSIRKVTRIRSSSGLIPVKAVVDNKVSFLNKIVKAELSYKIGGKRYTKAVKLLKSSLNFNKGDNLTIYYEKGYPENAILSEKNEEEFFKSSIYMDILYIIFIMFSVILFIFI